jgi:phosphatidylglycerol---prolipoprotein diacylglyceryl transferase
MLTIDVDPILLHVGPVMLSWYGLIVALALFVGVRFTLNEAVRKGIATDPVLDVAMWAGAGGLVGARLLHVLDRWSDYAANPISILAVQNGGLAIQGAIVGGALAGGVAARRAGLPVRKLFDAAAPGVVLGQAIGRLGCLVTGDALGPATDGTWGVVYRNPGAMAPELGVAYQPTFLYEAAWDLGVFAVLGVLRRRGLPDGHLFALYAGLYAAGKFGLTFLRQETVWLLGLQEAQLMALVVVVAAALWSAWDHRRAGAAQVA